jgi:hypothetical protein
MIFFGSKMNSKTFPLCLSLKIISRKMLRKKKKRQQLKPTD